jgi:cyclohexanone monooxygenase
VDLRNNRPTDPAWVASLKPGWQQERMDNFNTVVSGGEVEEDMVKDGWTDIFRNLTANVAKQASQKLGRRLSPQERAELMELADYQKMNQVRARVDEIVEDPETAEKLKPWYRQFCKRPCFHDEYLQTFNRPNVQLVDTQGRGVERITENGIVFDGVEYEVDCIIYATGFEVGTSFTRRSGLEVYGRDGLTLSDKWADGVRTMHGFHSYGFPNCFIISLMQSAMTVNFPHMLDVQAQHLAYLIGHALENGVTEIEVTEEAEEEWVQTILNLAVMNMNFAMECTPGYYNNEGQPSDIARQNGPYGLGAPAFIELLENWRKEGAFAGLELRP